MMLQSRIRLRRWSLLPALILALSLASPTLAVPAHAAEAGSRAMVTIDTPSANLSLARDQTIQITGWAVDPAVIGTGIQRVDVYLDGAPGVGIYIGSASYGLPRPDVAAIYGREDWANCGFMLDWTPRNISAGKHTLFVSASSAESGSVVKATSLNVRTAQAGPGGAPGPGGPSGGYGYPGPDYGGGYGYGGPDYGDSSGGSGYSCPYVYPYYYGGYHYGSAGIYGYPCYYLQHYYGGAYSHGYGGYGYPYYGGFGHGYGRGYGYF